MNTTTQDTLIRAGLEEKKAELYLILLEQGESTMPEILPHTSLSRATVYDILPQLMAEEFVSYRKDGRTAYYSAVHPNKIFSLLEEKKRQLSLLEGEIGTTVQSLAGTYNLANNKPGVRFFEGVDGAKELTLDTLHAKNTILTFLNPSEIHPSLHAFNEEYVTNRTNKGIPKKILVPDTPENRMRYNIKKPLLDVRFFSVAEVPFRTSVQIYNNTVSFATLSIDRTIGVLIEDEDVAMFHTQIFEFIWQNGTVPIYQESDSGDA